MDIKAKYIERLKEICGLFEIGYDQDPDIFEGSDIEAYKNAVEELRFITGKTERNTYLEEIEASKNELPFPNMQEAMDSINLK